MTAWREHAVRGAQLLAVSGFALAQPLFDILGKNAEFFAVRGSTPSDIVLFALAVTFVPAARTAVDRARSRARVRARRGRPALRVPRGARCGLRRTGAEAQRRRRGDGADRGRRAHRRRRRRRRVACAGRAPVPDHPRGRAAPLPRSLPLQLEGRAARLPGHGERLGGDRRVLDPRRLPALRRVPGDRPDEGKRRHRREALPQLRAARALIDVVPQHELAVRDDDAGGSGDPDRQPADPRRAADRGELSNNLFTLLASRYRMVVTESQTRLCPPQICKRKDASAESRLSSLYRDARVVYLHLLAPPSLEDRLPVIDESWGNFGTDTAGELSEQLPKVNGDTFYIGRVRDFNRFVAAFRAPKTKPTLYFLHLLMPHGPWLYAPDGHVRAVAKTPRAGTDRRALDERRSHASGLAAAPLAGRLHGQAARPVHPAAASRSASGTGRSSSSAPITASPSAPATCAATPHGRTCPSSRSSRSS